MYDIRTLLILALFTIALGLYLWFFRRAFKVNLHLVESPSWGASYRRFREIFEHSSDAVFVIEVQSAGRFRFESLNPAAMQAFDPMGTGLARKQLDESIQCARDSDHRRFLLDLAERLGQAVTSGMPVRYSATLASITTMERSFDINLVPMVDDGGLSHILCFASDVTTRQRYENELRRRIQMEERFTAFAASAPGFFFSFRHGVDGSNSMPFASDGISELFGLQPRDVADSIASLMLLIHPDDNAGFFDAVARSAAAMSRFTVEFRVRHPERGDIWVEARAMPLVQKDGSILWNGFMHDISERKLAEQQLRQSRVSLAEAQRIGQMASWEADLAGENSVWSEEMYRILELDPMICPPSRAALLNATHPEDREIRSARFAEALDYQVSFRIDYRLLFPDGRIKYVREIGEVHGSGQDGPAHLHGVIQDITALKLTELQLKDAQDKLRELVINRELMREDERKRVAWEMHEELGQMLAAVQMRLGGARMAVGQGRQVTEAEYQAMAELIERSIRRVREIVSELRPTVLMHGVSAGLEWLAAEFNKHPGMRCELVVDDEGSEPANEALTTLVFRLAQDALEDAMRHPGTANVNLLWRNGEQGASLRIQHDGDSSSSDLTASHSLRLFGMHERVVAVGGRFNISTQEAGGVDIEVSFPV